MKKTWWISFVIIACAGACTSSGNKVPYYNTASFMPLWKGEEEFSPDTLHTIAPFSFVDQVGDTITNKTFRGKIYVANFFYTVCPGICPKMTTNLQQVADTFADRDDVLFISHSVTPEIDSVPQLYAYAQTHHIDHRRWHLVTGDKDQIYSLARKSYFAEQDIGFQYSTQQFLHTEHLILVDRNGHIRGIYKGTLPLETEKLIADIRALLASTDQ